jgi:nitrogen fixation protein FixH
MAEKSFKLTGWHVLAIFIGAYVLIIGANMTLAVSAVRTFPGLETDNSYVSSQTFDDRRAAQESLGWAVSADYSDGRVILDIRDANGKPVEAAQLDATLGRPTHVKDDRTPDFRFDGSGYVAEETLAPGNWNIRMTAVAENGTPFEQRIVFFVRD